jgi:hypothetical protein
VQHLSHGKGGTYSYTLSPYLAGSSLDCLFVMLYRREQWFQCFRSGVRTRSKNRFQFTRASP